MRAAMLGLYAGMSLADARAAVPDLASLPHDRAADQHYLEQLAEFCSRYTPLLALDAPDGLILDISGCAHLFGGEAGLIADLRAAMNAQHLSLRYATGSTAEAGRALARFAPASSIAEPLSLAAESAAIAALPVAALGLADEAYHALIRAGLKTLGDLSAQPMAHIAARFGMAAATALRRLRGEESSPLDPRRSQPPIWADRLFAEPIASTDYALKILGELAEACARALAERGEGGRQFRATFFRSDGKARSISVETGQPCRDAAVLIRLFQERVDSLRDPIDPGFGFDRLRLIVPLSEAYSASQLALQGGTSGSAQRSDDLILLADRLATRLGKAQVRRYRPADSHIPEQAQFELPASEAPAAAAPIAWERAPEGEPPMRPFYLFDPPEPVEVLAEVPDGPPHRFRWRNILHHVLRYEGPERISAEWWRRADNKGLTRDYYRIEDMKGRRYWLFRHGLYDEKSAPRWYIHGRFA